MLNRPRRLRQNCAIREMVQESSLRLNEMIYPMFVTSQKGALEPILSLDGHYRYGPDRLIEEIGALFEKHGIQSFALFPHFPESLKDRDGKLATDGQNFYLQTICDLKARYPDIVIMGDVALDPYSSDGHDGLVDTDSGEIINDETVEILARMACLQASAGVDIIGPSDMMDGRVKSIRQALERNGHQQTIIMSYCAKYASSFYGPFRQALESAPKNGDKKSYQMDFANSREALREAQLDIEEGADILLVKPALAYLDIIYQFNQNFHLPVAAYQVSGEYAMIDSMAKQGHASREQLALECLTSIKRAGAKIILSYFTKDLAQYLR